jgi:hypothetical protein
LRAFCSDATAPAEKVGSTMTAAHRAQHTLTKSSQSIECQVMFCFICSSSPVV